MGKYGLAAQSAAQILASGGSDPRAAWEQSVARIFPDSRTAREKGCPRDTFLALCTMGIIKGVPSGAYTRSVKNRAYAMRAINELKNNPSIVNDEHALWRRVTEKREIVSNHQMDVVTTLWRRGFLSNFEEED